MSSSWFVWSWTRGFVMLGYHICTVWGRDGDDESDNTYCTSPLLFGVPGGGVKKVRRRGEADRTKGRLCLCCVCASSAVLFYRFVPLSFVSVVSGTMLILLVSLLRTQEVAADADTKVAGEGDRGGGRSWSCNGRRKYCSSLCFFGNVSPKA